MKRLLAFILLLVLLDVSHANSEAFTKVPKVGTKCFRLNEIKFFNGDKLICKKSDEKLQWQSKKSVKKHGKTSKSPKKSKDKDSQRKILLSESKLITPSSLLTPISFCKTNDISGRDDVSSGFPRPNYVLQGKVNPKILVVPISFTDFPFTSNDLTSVQAVAEEVTKFYKKTSYGNVNLEFTILNSEYWIAMNSSASSYNLIENKPQQNNISVVRDALAKASNSIAFNFYDAVVVETAKFQSTGGGQAFPGMSFPTANGMARGVFLEFGSGVAKFETLAHELGHALFGLEDLYVFLNSERPTVPDSNPAGSWDMMSNSSQEFFAWSKWLNGWLTDAQIRCVKDQQKSHHYLEKLSVASKEPKALVVNIDSGVSLVFEVRPISGAVIGGYSLGLLAYEVDTRISHGDGPIKAQKQLLYSGKSWSNYGWTIKVINQDSSGLLIELTKS